MTTDDMITIWPYNLIEPSKHLNSDAKAPPTPPPPPQKEGAEFDFLIFLLFGPSYCGIGAKGVLAGLLGYLLSTGRAWIDVVFMLPGLFAAVSCVQVRVWIDAVSNV
ncbi:hypothetical protein DID88_007225 [Monilinia fructigena]|uniref:Uncharacterized protein n=1 Tax=Monilinia fructigena TaxID=38457 RepID=A0A395J7P0_9HELO|nr:hypothetical protein DID88_007225 [Monilinia fructigena]